MIFMMTFQEFNPGIKYKQIKLPGQDSNLQPMG